MGALDVAWLDNGDPALVTIGIGRLDGPQDRPSAILLLRQAKGADRDHAERRACSLACLVVQRGCSPFQGSVIANKLLVKNAKGSIKCCRRDSQNAAVIAAAHC
jgi:hypothetical protein